MATKDATTSGSGGTGEGQASTTERIDRQAREIGERSGSVLQRLGFSRVTGGILLLVLGILVLVFPDLITWIVGVGSLVLGVLVLASAEDPALEH